MYQLLEHQQNQALWLNIALWLSLDSETKGGSIVFAIITQNTVCNRDEIFAVRGEIDF